VSKLAQPNGDDFPEAADKLVDDSAILHGGNRHDGAAYLAGYVVECCLKTILLLETKTTWGHHLTNLTTEISRLYSIAGTKTAKYASAPAVKQLPASPVIQWNPDMRYRSAGSVSPAAAAIWVHDAKAVYDATIVEMRLDGVI